jgi:hypothetical protein
MGSFVLFVPIESRMPVAYAIDSTAIEGGEPTTRRGIAIVGYAESQRVRRTGAAQVEHRIAIADVCGLNCLSAQVIERIGTVRLPGYNE